MTINDDYKIILDIDDLEKSQAKIDEYIEHNSLNNTFPNGEKEGIFINIKEVIDENS